LITNATILLTVSTGAAYIVGVWSVTSFADGAGVDSADLGFEFRDYVLLTALNLLPLLAAISAVAVGIAVINRFRNSNRRLLVPPTLVAMTVLAMTAGALLSGSRLAELILGGLAVGFFVTVVVSIVVTIERTGRKIALLLLLAVPTFGVIDTTVSSIANIGAESQFYGEQLGDFGHHGSNLAFTSNPAGLAMLIRPQTGVATLNGMSACVVRIRGNVLADNDDVIVVAQLDKFVPSDCAVSNRAFEDGL
jgi:hypothetical protein